MLITDGKQTRGYNGPSPADVAKAMRNRGIEIQVIGIGRYIDETELLQLVSHPRLLRTPKNFGDSLSSILDEQVRSLCSGKLIKNLLQTLITTSLPHPGRWALMQSIHRIRKPRQTDTQILEIRVSKNLAKLGRGRLAKFQGWNRIVLL